MDNIRPVVRRAIDAALENDKEAHRLLKTIHEHGLSPEISERIKACVEKKQAWDRRPWSQ